MWTQPCARPSPVQEGPPASAPPPLPPPNTHTRSAGEDCKLQAGGFTCPRCAARSAQLPSQCHVCALTLVSSPHLARSYHHLFPAEPFQEVERRAVEAAAACDGRLPDLAPAAAAGRPYCYGCCRPLLLAAAPAAAQQQGQGRAQPRSAATALAEAAEGVVVRCPGCRSLFCFDCDAFVHGHLHNCPGCEALLFQEGAAAARAEQQQQQQQQQQEQSGSIAVH